MSDEGDGREEKEDREVSEENVVNEKSKIKGKRVGESEVNAHTSSLNIARYLK
jgi:hypothetical protein